MIQRWAVATVTAASEGTGPGDRAVFSLASEGQAAVTGTFATSCHPEPWRQGLQPEDQGRSCQPGLWEQHRCPHELRGRSIKSQRIVLEPEDLMEPALLGFKLALDSSSLSSFQSLPFRIKMSLLCLPHHCILETRIVLYFVF